MVKHLVDHRRADQAALPGVLEHRRIAGSQVLARTAAPGGIGGRDHATQLSDVQAQFFQFEDRIALVVLQVLQVAPDLPGGAAEAFVGKQAIEPHAHQLGELFTGRLANRRKLYRVGEALADTRQ